MLISFTLLFESWCQQLHWSFTTTTTTTTSNTGSLNNIKDGEEQ